MSPGNPGEESKPLSDPVNMSDWCLQRDKAKHNHILVNNLSQVGTNLTQRVAQSEGFMPQKPPVCTTQQLIGHSLKDSLIRLDVMLVLLNSGSSF